MSREKRCIDKMYFPDVIWKALIIKSNDWLLKVKQSLSYMTLLPKEEVKKQLWKNKIECLPKNFHQQYIKSSGN